MNAATPGPFTVASLDAMKGRRVRVTTSERKRPVLLGTIETAYDAPVGPMVRIATGERAEGTGFPLKQVVPVRHVLTIEDAPDEEPAVPATDPTVAKVPVILRCLAEEEHERRMRWGMDSLDLDGIMERGFGVTAFRDRVALELDLTAKQARDLCDAAVGGGLLAKVGGGSLVKYADGETTRAAKARRAEFERRRDAAVAALAVFGIEAHVARERITLSVASAEAVVAHLRGEG